MKRALASALAHVDAGVNRLSGWRLNPLYQSGSIVVLTLVLMLVTGLYLLLYYRIGAPADSVVRISGQVWSGRWIRALHRYSADLAVVAVLFHAARMFVQGRTWGPRAQAWISGLFLVFLLYVCGWTGYVMVWDGQAHLLAAEGARLLDGLPFFAQPIGRTFSGESAPPAAFFFLNLFLHIAVPIGMAGGLWLHVSRVARPVLLPPRGLLWVVVGLLTVLSVVWAAPPVVEADLLALPGRTVVDGYYAFWLPLARLLSVGWVWAGLVLGSGVLIAVPFLTRPEPTRVPPPSRVDSRFCTGCEQCYVDCPYDAISMVSREDERPYEIAQVDPAHCVSCGICAASCAPMGVGPPSRSGRDQLERVQDFLSRTPLGSSPVILVACTQSARVRPAKSGTPPVFSVTCAGNLHTSVVEYLVRSGAGGVLIVACPPRDCVNREGSVWLEQRLYHDREAELQARVDRRRVRVVYAGSAEGHLVEAALQEFGRDVESIGRPSSEVDLSLDLECPVAEAEVST